MPVWFFSKTTGTPSTRVRGRLLICGTSKFAVKGGREGAERAAAKPPCSGSAAQAVPPRPGAGRGRQRRWQTPAMAPGRRAALLTAGLCCHQGSASAEPGRRSQHLPPTRPGVPCSPPGTDRCPARPPSPAPTCGPGSSASCPPRRRSADTEAASARSTSRPLSLSARLPSLPRRSPSQTTPNKPKQQKSAAKDRAGFCGCLVWRKGG